MSTKQHIFYFIDTQICENGVCVLITLFNVSECFMLLCNVTGNARCPTDKFTCDSGSVQCATRCDAVTECENNEDEEGCTEGTS